MNIKKYRAETVLDKRLVTAVIEQLGLDDEDETETLHDIAQFGINSGFSGFTYYTETVEFYMENQPLIVNQLREDAQGYGQWSMMEMVRNFACCDEETTEDEIGKTLFSDDHYELVANCLAWYAAETVARDCLNQNLKNNWRTAA